MKPRVIANVLGWSLFAALIGACYNTPDQSTCRTWVEGSAPGCPEYPPTPTDLCDIPELTCTYTTGICVQTFACLPNTPDPEDPLDCSPAGDVWKLVGQTYCDEGCVPGCGPCSGCHDNHEGDLCHAVGYRCRTPYKDGECSVSMVCTPYRVWETQTKPGCCN